MRGAGGSFSSAARGQTSLLAAPQLIKGRNPRLILLASDGVGIVVSFQSSSSLCAVLLLRVLELLDLLLESGYLSLRLSLCSAQDLFFFKDARNPRTSSSSDEHLSQ